MTKNGFPGLRILHLMAISLLLNRRPPSLKKTTQYGNTYHPIFVSNASVEFFAFNDQERIPGFEDTAFGGDGACCVDVVTCDHAHCDASLLTLLDGSGYLGR